MPMAKVIGAIDNAAIHKEFYHIVFTQTGIVMCKVMDRSEFKAIIRGTHPLLQAFIAGNTPVVGHSMEKLSLEQTSDFLYSTNKNRGEEIGKDLDSYMKEHPDNVKSLDYNDVESIILVDGKIGPAPILTINSPKGNMKFRLSGAIMGYSVDGALYSNGSDNFLRAALGSKFVLK